MSSNITAVKNQVSGGNGFLLGDWQERLASIVEAMREMSMQSDPLKMVRAYRARVRAWMPAARWISLSRRGARGTLVSDHALEHLDRDDRSLEGEAPVAAALGRACWPS